MPLSPLPLQPSLRSGKHQAPQGNSILWGDSGARGARPLQFHSAKPAVSISSPLPKPTHSNSLSPVPFLALGFPVTASHTARELQACPKTGRVSTRKMNALLADGVQRVQRALNGKHPGPSASPCAFLVLLACQSPPGPTPPRPRAGVRKVSSAEEPSTLFLFLLLLLLQLPLLDAAEVGLPDATSLADGLQETGAPSRGVHHLLRGSLDRSCRDGRTQRQCPSCRPCSRTLLSAARGCKPGTGSHSPATGD